MTPQTIAPVTASEIAEITDLPFKMDNGILNGMKNLVSIDQAGRIILPKRLRDQFCLHAGSQLEIATRSDHFELKPVEAMPAMVCEEGLWVHQGEARAPIGEAVRQMREERLGHVSR